METPKPAPLGEVADPAGLAPALLTLVGCPDLCSRAWVWDQYDATVGGQTVRRPGGADAAVVKIEGSRRALALTTDCTPRYCQADPEAGGAQAVAEAWRNITATGALPLAIQGDRASRCEGPGRRRVRFQCGSHGDFIHGAPWRCARHRSWTFNCDASLRFANLDRSGVNVS